MSRINSGRIVETKDGRTGRTFNRKGLINDKVPFYECVEFKEYSTHKMPFKFSDTATLIDPKDLKIIGYID